MKGKIKVLNSLCRYINHKEIKNEREYAMGMAASQARFLGLTARKTNVEYEGQQVNQQRTTLSNQSANYYNQLLGMAVPVPPSVDDYTKTVYSFTDGALENVVTSLIAQGDGEFLVSYTRSYTDDTAVVGATSSIVTRSGSAGAYKYSVGAKEVRQLSSKDTNGNYVTDPSISYDATNKKATYTGDDEYLKSLTEEQLAKLVEEEAAYKEKLDQKYNNNTASDNDAWQVYYRQDTTSGTWNPVFYKKNDLEKDTTIYSDKTGASQSFIPAYSTGTERVTDEIKGTTAKLEQDSSGRYINITLNPGTENQVTYSLTTQTTTDQDAYNDAMNQYEYDKTSYDKAIQDINTKIEIIQSQDKNLELRLKQLDTEQDAISTEMDAVQKVIEKNTESTFKTFG